MDVSPQTTRVETGDGEEEDEGLGAEEDQEEMGFAISWGPAAAEEPWFS